MSVLSQFARAVLWRGKRSRKPSERCVQRATHPPDLALGRAASIRTCFAARKPETASFVILSRLESTSYKRCAAGLVAPAPSCIVGDALTFGLLAAR